MLTTGISFKLNLDVLLTRDSWPNWLIDGIDYLQSISAEEKWESMLVSFVEFERQLGPAGLVS